VGWQPASACFTSCAGTRAKFSGCSETKPLILGHRVRATFTRCAEARSRSEAPRTRRRSAAGGDAPIYWITLRTTLWFSLALTTLIASAGDAQSRRFAVAIVRLDGGLVPFAEFDGARWQQAWPEADRPTERAPTIDGIESIWRKRGERVPRVWTVWPATGASSAQARVNGIEVAEGHCEGQVALKTTLRPIKAEHPVKFGVAVDSNLPVGSIEEISQSNSIWRSAEQVVLSSLSKVEAAQAQTEHQELPRETPQPVARITELYREAKSPRSPIYFIAEKKYRTPSFPQDPSCERITVMTGWLVPTAGGALALRDAKVVITDCDKKEVRTALPLAVIHVSNHLFWVLQEHGYEDETYLIAEIGPTDVRYPIQVNGGGC
jgi:hypothetical protein